MTYAQFWSNMAKRRISLHPWSAKHEDKPRRLQVQKVFHNVHALWKFVVEEFGVKL
jgi:hypothetical protein